MAKKTSRTSGGPAGMYDDDSRKRISDLNWAKVLGEENKNLYKELKSLATEITGMASKNVYLFDELNDQEKDLVKLVQTGAKLRRNEVELLSQGLGITLSRLNKEKESRKELHSLAEEVFEMTQDLKSITESEKLQINLARNAVKLKKEEVNLLMKTLSLIKERADEEKTANEKIQDTVKELTKETTAWIDKIGEGWLRFKSIIQS